MLQPTLSNLTLTGEPQPERQKRSKRKGPQTEVDIRRKTKKREFIDGRREGAAIERVLKLPGDGESIHIVCSGRFGAIDLIPAIRRMSGQKIVELWITTLSYSENNIDRLCRGVDDGKLGRIVLFTSDYFSKAETTLHESTKEKIESRGGVVHAIRTHTKLIMLTLEDDQQLVIEGSGNLRSCRSIEQFVISNDRELMDFHRKWLEDHVSGN